MNNGASSADFYIDAVTNNSFEASYVENTLLDVFHNSYGFLDNAQKHAISLSRSNFLISDLIRARAEPGKLKIQVSRDLIDPTAREEYRTSKFYRQVLKLSDIANNQDIFARMPIVYIDGMMITQYTVKAFFDKTFIYIKDTPEIRSHKDITVFFVINDGMATGILNRKNFNAENNKLPASKFSHTGIWETPFTSIVTGNNIFGSSTNLSTSDGDIVDIEFSDNADILISENKPVTVTILRSRYMHVYRDKIDTYYNGSTDSEGKEVFIPRPFVLTDDDGDSLKMPVPVENIIVFKKDYTKGNDYYLDNHSTVTRIYPNIYLIDDPDSTMNCEYRVAYFYHPLDGYYHYTNYLANLWKVALIYYEQYIDKPTVVDIVIDILKGPENFDSQEEYDKWATLINYQPPDFEYTIPDFLQDPSNNPFDYKIGKMCEAIRNDPWVLRDYVKAQSHCNYGYELDVSRIKGGLESRRRMSSSSEAKFIDHKRNFDVPCYVFNFNIGSKINFELTFFINGLYVQPVYMFEEFFTKYIYIPCDLVDETSLIDVEENDSYVFEKEVDLADGKEARVTINIPGGSNIHPLMKNIKAKDESGYTLTHSELSQNFEFKKRDGSLEFPITDKEYTPISTFTVKYKPSKSREFDAGLTEYTIIVDKSNTICDYTSDEDPILVTMMPRAFWDDPSRVRVFVNGKLIDSSALVMVYYDTEHSILLVKKPLKFGDEVSVLLSPNYYEKVFSMDMIPEDGIINLSYELNKPVNLTYYDFYLNGRKLTTKEITQLSPNIIQIHDVRSRRNLSIYEKDRDPIEYFGRASEYQTNYDSIKTLEDEMLDANGKWYEQRTDLIRILWENAGKEYPELGVTIFDLEDDVLRDLISGETADMIIYIFKTFYWLSRINPDEKQIDGTHVSDHYETVKYWLSADSSSEDGSENVFMINPDVMAGSTEIIQPVSGDKFYTQYKIDYEQKE